MTNRTRWFGVFSLLLIVVIAYVDRVNMAVLIVDHDFLSTFGLVGDRAGQGSLMSVFLLGYGVAALVLTPLYESFLGYRRGLLISMLVWAVLTALSPLSGSLFALLVVRAFLGVSEGPLFSLKTMFVRDHFAGSERGKPNAVSSMGVSLGLAVGFPLVSVLLHSFGWAASFHALALINLLVGIPLVYFFIRKPAFTDATGAASSVVPVVQKQSIWDVFRGALGTPHLGSILLIEIFTLAYLWGSSSWLPAYLVDDKGFSLRQMGWISSLPFLIGIAANFLGGVMVDLIPPKRTPLVFTLGGLVCAASVFALVGSRSTFSTLGFLLLASAFWGIQGAAIPTLIQRFSPANSVGSAYGIINGIGNMVAAFMPAAMGSLMKVHVSAGFSLLIIAQV
ncbi:MAG: MFS transporter, partial [Rhodoferax sp.]